MSVSPQACFFLFFLLILSCSSSCLLSDFFFLLPSLIPSTQVPRLNANLREAIRNANYKDCEFRPGAARSPCLRNGKRRLPPAEAKFAFQLGVKIRGGNRKLPGQVVSYSSSNFIEASLIAANLSPEPEHVDNLPEHCVSGRLFSILRPSLWGTSPAADSPVCPVPAIGPKPACSIKVPDSCSVGFRRGPSRVHEECEIKPRIAATRLRHRV